MNLQLDQQLVSHALLDLKTKKMTQFIAIYAKQVRIPMIAAIVKSVLQVRPLQITLRPWREKSCKLQT